MGTGACGIDCTVCRLHVMGVCSTCGSGISAAAKEKLDAQINLFGQGCPILACAVDRQISFCLRDCDDFPCENFSSGPYPFAEGFLQMQKRRRDQAGSVQQAAWPSNAVLFWKRLAERDPAEMCRAAGATAIGNDTYQIQCLNETWFVDPADKSIVKKQGTFGGEWDRQVPFFILVYLSTANDKALSGNMVAPRSLYGGQDFFKGRYTLDTNEAEDLFGKNMEAFEKAGTKLGAKKVDQADLAQRFFIFPKLPVDYLLWSADEEFPARLTILLDQRTPEFCPADATAVLINQLTRRILMAAKD